MPTARLETFADGVFAIAATLLIIDVTADAPGDGLGGALTHAWPQYVAYLVSFVTIGIMWVNHHTLFRHFERVDRPLLLLNILLLMLIAFVPFPTRVAADFVRSGGDRRAAALLYGSTMTITAVLFIALWLYGSRRLLAADSDPLEVSGITRSYLPGVPLYGGTTLLAFASPVASLVLFGAIALFYALSSSYFGRAE